MEKKICNKIESTISACYLEKTKQNKFEFLLVNKNKKLTDKNAE